MIVTFAEEKSSTYRPEAVYVPPRRQPTWPGESDASSACAVPSPGKATLLQEGCGVAQAGVGTVASVRAERLPAGSNASTPSLGLCPHSSEPNTKLVPVVLETRVPLR